MGQNLFPGGSSRLTTVHLLKFCGRGTENLNIGLNTRGKEIGSRAHTLLVGSDTRASRRSSRLSRVRFPVRVHSPCAAGVRCGGRYCHRFYTNKFTLPTYVSRIIWRKTDVTSCNRTRVCVYCAVRKNTCAFYKISAGKITVTFEKVSYVTKAQCIETRLAAIDNGGMQFDGIHMSLCRNKSLSHSPRGFICSAFFRGRSLNMTDEGDVVCGYELNPLRDVKSPTGSD